MNVPQLRFKGFNKEWQRKQVKEILDYEQPTKYIVTSTEYSDNYSIPVLTANKSFILGYTNETEGIYNKKCIIFDDFTQESKYVDFPFKVKSSAIKILSTKSNDDLYFIFNLLQVTPLIDEGHRRYYIDIVQKQKLLIPCIKEQQKIGTFFSKLDDLITKQTHKVTLLKQLKQGYLQKLFPQAGQTTPQLRFKGFNEEWHEKYLKNVVQYENGKGHEQNISQNGNYIVVNSKYISSNGKIKKFTNVPLKILNKNMIVFVLSDVPNGKALAKALIIDKNNKYTLNQRIAGLTVDKNYNVLFMYYLINRNSYFLRFNNGVSQTNMSKSDVLSFKFLIPDLSEQQKISALFAKLDHLIELQNRKLALLKELKKGYLQKMFI